MIRCAMPDADDAARYCAMVRRFDTMPYTLIFNTRAREYRYASAVVDVYVYCYLQRRWLLRRVE